MSDLQRRIRRLEDRAELQDLVVRYFLAADDDYDALAATFAADCYVCGRRFRWRIQP
jgi:SnoaL-like domain